MEFNVASQMFSKMLIVFVPTLSDSSTSARWLPMADWFAPMAAQTTSTDENLELILG